MTSGRAGPWAMLLALAAAFAMSQAFRTVAAMMAAPLQADFHLSPQQLGSFAGAFHFAFGAMQLFVGIGIDLHGLRRTILTGFPLAMAGAVLSAVAPGFGVLLLGQVLIGLGCAPAFLVCTVFIARHFPARRFAAVSGAVMSIGGLGMLATGTPLAWLVEASSWRMGFWVLAGGSAAAWALIAWTVHEPASSGPAPERQGESLGRAALSFVWLLRQPCTPGILLLSFVCYASFMTLRGLWLGPLLIGGYGFSLVHSGHVALVVSVVSLVSPALFGHFDPGDGRRRRWLLACTLWMAALFCALALVRDARVAVAACVAVGLLSGYMVLQYSEVRLAYPAPVVGRAMALFTMAMFLGVAVMQSLTGTVASVAMAQGADIYPPVLLAVAALLVVGGLAFAGLPRAYPPGAVQPGPAGSGR